jgi:hypothetical protein
MDPIVLTDPTITPNDELVFSIIGDKRLLWQKISEYLYTRHKDISEVWRFYNDGKCWMFRYLKKDKTICWIGVLENTFRVGFWFGAKAEPIVLSGDLPEHIKEEFKNAKKTKIGSGIGIVVNNQVDVETVIKLMELRIKIK